MSKLPNAAPKPKKRPPKARQPIARSGRPARKKRIKAKPRPKAETLRTFGTEEHRIWMKRQPCVFCGIVGFSDAAHVRNGGMSRRADWEFSVPACRNVPEYSFAANAWTASSDPSLGVVRLLGIRPGCHHDFDANKKTWREKYDTDALAAKCASDWLAHRSRGRGEG